jgi:hypothetical protein
VTTSEKMAKTKNLNGIPNNLAKSYLSTYGYYQGGYMADWINYIAREKNISEIEIDILNKKVTPKEANIKPLISDLEKLKNIIKIELKNCGFEISFIKIAKMRFEIPLNTPNINPIVYCYPHLEDENGKIYKPKNRIVEVAYEVNFNTIKEN